MNIDHTLNTSTDILSLLLLAVAMAMDAFSVATVTGFGLKKLDYSLAVKMSVVFGVFHVIMPYIGWVAGSSIVGLISNYDHWLAFLLLAFVGGKMIKDSREDAEEIDPAELMTVSSLAFLAVAVSIDSLAVGLSYSLEQVNILLPAISMGLGTLVFTFIGVYLGHKTGKRLGKTAQVIGGLILIGIGLRILLEHL